jgi:hypothetical protein
MPWSGNHLPWSLSEILFHVPGTSGVYAIWRQDTVVYVGETNDLQRRLLEHFKGSNPCIGRQNPTSFGFELSTPAARLARHESLVREMRPICNLSSP